MALTANYLWVWKWVTVDGSTLFDIYGKMFDPNVPDFPSNWNTVSAHNEATSFNLLWFQPWLEVCVCVIEVYNGTSSTVSWNVECSMQQYKSWSRYTPSSNTVNFWYVEIEPGYYRVWYMWVWIDPDEIRPWITDYRFHRSVAWKDFYKTFSVSNLSFDSTPHDAGYMWVEWNNLCYVPPSYYSGSSSTGYKHIIDYDSGYSWANAGTDAKWSIWIPSSSSDHHIYYVTEYWYVYRTKESYAWSGWSSSAWSNKSGYIWMTPSTSGYTEQAWYNYLCYVDGWGYKRRMWVWEL